MVIWGGGLSFHEHNMTTISVSIKESPSNVRLQNELPKSICIEEKRPELHSIHRVAENGTRRADSGM